MNRNTTIETRYDAVVVGARVAGASTALLLARAGKRVLVLDKGVYGSDTTSTHALMRPGVFQLHRWGVLDRIVAAGTPAIRGTTFHYGEETIEIAIQERDGVGALYAPRRTVIDPALADAARQSGAQVVYGAHVDGVMRDDSGRVCGVTLTDPAGIPRRVEAGIVIGADGVRSGVARAVTAVTRHEGLHPASYLYGYWRGVALDHTHWYYGRDVAAGAIPTGGGLVCVFVGMRPARYEAARPGELDALFRRVLMEMDAELACRLARAERVGKLHPFAGRPGFIRAARGPGWALVGDASAFRDPLTAHGMTDALRDAEMLARAVVAGTDEAMAGYETARDELAVEFLGLSDEIASFDWDFDRVKGLHRRLSKLMTREYEHLRSIDESTLQIGC